MVTAFTVMLVCVGLPFTVGAALTAAPAPLSTALATTEPDGIIALPDAPEMFVTGMEVGSVIVLGVVVAVLSVPVTGTVTTVPFVRCAVPAVNPGGRLEIVKSAGVMVEAYVPLESVNVTLAGFAVVNTCPTVRPVSPLPAATMAGVVTVPAGLIVSVKALDVTPLIVRVRLE